MKNIFQPGEKKFFDKTVTHEDTAAFESGLVHPVYSTFALARDAEWTCRLFVLEMKEDDEEGIGTFISVEHQSPAFIGETVQFTSTLNEVSGNQVVCGFEAKVADRVIAAGKQIQKILKKEKIETLFQKIKHG